MNLNTAVETMRKSISLDNRHGVSKALAQLIDSLGNLASNPAEASYQQAVRASLDNLANRTSAVETELSEADAIRLAELGADDLFPEKLYPQVVGHFDANIGTPAVAREFVQSVKDRRDEIILGFEQVITVAEDRDWASDEDFPEGAEVGFTVPRAVFDNKLKGLTKELEWINRFMATVSEATTGSHDDFEITRLSTSDPSVFILTSVAVAYTFGNVVKWALDTWKTVEEIRGLRAQTSKVAAFSAEEIETIFGDKIKQQVAIQVEAQAADMTAGIENIGRKNELHTALTMQLNQFLQRVERGMTVEVRLISHASDEEPVPVAESQLRTDLETLSSGLSFPAASPNPVLKLTGGASDAEKRAGRGSRAAA